MSVAGISSTSFYNPQSVSNKMQQVRQEFQQLGQDLQSGNLSAAQADFATLQQLSPQANSTSSSPSTNPIAQEFNQLSQDLNPGTLRRRNRTTRRFSRISKVKQGMPTIIITVAAAVNRVESASCLNNWDKSCNPATSRRPSRPTARCSRTSCSSRKVDRLPSCRWHSRLQLAFR